MVTHLLLEFPRETSLNGMLLWWSLIKTTSSLIKRVLQGWVVFAGGKVGAGFKMCLIYPRGLRLWADVTLLHAFLNGSLTFQMVFWKCRIFTKKDNARYAFSHMDSGVVKGLHSAGKAFQRQNYTILHLFSHVHRYWKCFHESKGKGVGVQAPSKRKSQGLVLRLSLEAAQDQKN